jgi:hypothetical protein
MQRKTVIIYDQLDAGIKFLVMDGDFRHLNGVYINSCAPFDATEEEEAAWDAERGDVKQEELTNLIYDENTSALKVTFLDTFPVADVQSGADVIVAGFLP